jgi:hypothetical protein
LTEKVLVSRIFFLIYSYLPVIDHSSQAGGEGYFPQHILSGFYLLRDKFFEIISNIFGPPTLYGLIQHKTVSKFLTVEKCGACESALDFCSPPGKTFTCCIQL